MRRLLRAAYSAVIEWWFPLLVLVAVLVLFGQAFFDWLHGTNFSDSTIPYERGP